MSEKHARAMTFVEAFTLSETSLLPEFFCEISTKLPTVPGHAILGNCDQCEQELKGKMHVCVGDVLFEDFNFDSFDEDDDCDDDD